MMDQNTLSVQNQTGSTITQTAPTRQRPLAGDWVSFQTTAGNLLITPTQIRSVKTDKRRHLLIVSATTQLQEPLCQLSECGPDESFDFFVIQNSPPQDGDIWERRLLNQLNSTNYDFLHFDTVVAAALDLLNRPTSGLPEPGKIPQFIERKFKRLARFTTAAAESIPEANFKENEQPPSPYLTSPPDIRTQTFTIDVTPPIGLALETEYVFGDLVLLSSKPIQQNSGTKSDPPEFEKKPFDDSHTTGVNKNRVNPMPIIPVAHNYPEYAGIARHLIGKLSYRTFARNFLRAMIEHEAPDWVDPPSLQWEVHCLDWFDATRLRTTPSADGSEDLPPSKYAYQ